MICVMVYPPIAISDQAILSLCKYPLYKGIRIEGFQIGRFFTQTSEQYGQPQLALDGEGHAPACRRVQLCKDHAIHFDSIFKCAGLLQSVLTCRSEEHTSELQSPTNLVCS